MLQNMNFGGFSVCFLRKDAIFRRKITRKSTTGDILQHLSGDVIPKEEVL